MFRYIPARHRLEIPLYEDYDVPIEDEYIPSLAEILPKGLNQKEKKILILFYEAQLSYKEIANHLHISILNCRTRLFRAKCRFEELKEKEENLDNL